MSCRKETEFRDAGFVNPSSQFVCRKFTTSGVGSHSTCWLARLIRAFATSDERRLLIRWEYYAANFLCFAQLACSTMLLKQF